MSNLLQLTPASKIQARVSSAVDGTTLAAAAKLLEEVRRCGEPALRRIAERFDDLPCDAPLVHSREALLAARDAIPPEERALLERTARRIADFARAQRSCFGDLQDKIPGGRAGHRLVPVERAGCYAPGGRFPLPSSVLMTAVTARTAGVAEVWVASPRPLPITLAAAAVAGADALVPVGGAQAIAALAHGAGPIPACDVVVGPGNRWVTAAKKLVAGDVGIDMLAGPSELLVIADKTADAERIALDLIAQAEHDPDARAILISLCPELLGRVEEHLRSALCDHPNRTLATQSLENHGTACWAKDLEEGIDLCNRLAPEHLEVHLAPDSGWQVEDFRHYGGIFLGSHCAEVFGDYGAGPNHVLPTGGAARHTGGLSVMTFLRLRTWMELSEEPGFEGGRQLLARDAAQLARLEGLEGHARSAEHRAR